MRDELVLLHSGMVRTLASRFAAGGTVDREDLIQVGFIGLISAIEHFDPEAGTAFSSFAVPTIVGTIKNYLRDQTWDVVVPRRLRELAQRMNRVRERKEQEDGRAPTLTELALATGVSEERLVEAMEVTHLYRTLSLDASGNEDAPCRPSGPGELDHRLSGTDERVSLEQALLRLERRLRYVLCYRYLVGLSQTEAALRLGVSQMQVSRLERQALSSLRDWLCGPS